ncbi:MAG: hypothetical protein LLG01_13040 [Planctomycetaceae bacterium]|nr:hypothetical protein [Planctomycetaceae bacterium]
MRCTVDWSAFLARHDLIWTKTPHAWWEAPFLGNGLLGVMIRQAGGGNELQFDVGRADAYDHRPGGAAWLRRCRLPIGHFVLRTAGTIEGFQGRLDLWNAEFTGTVTTSAGVIGLRSFVHADRMLMLAEIAPDDGERSCRIEWHAEEAVCYNRTWAIETLKTEENEWARSWAQPDYVPHPPAELGRCGQTDYCLQRLIEGGQTATAWRVIEGPAARRTLVASIAHTYPQDTAVADACAEVALGAATPLETLAQSHRQWWHEYYPASFVSVPDSYWEGFYWIQMYKFASATRADRAMIDNNGPWYQHTHWPCAWFNLNVQLTYWLPADSNRLDLAESLIGRLDRYRGNLVANMPPEFGGDCAGLYTVVPPDLTSPFDMQCLGDLPWALHDYWRILRRSMDTPRMRDRFLPLLRQAISTYLHVIAPGDDGRLHIPNSFSPEYGWACDTNYNLALLRWCLQTAVALCEQFALPDPLLPRWREVLEQLVDYPVDENGYMIGRDTPFAMGHRHYSHLLMVYPLHLVRAEQAGARELIEKTLRHWVGFKEGKCGYTWTGAASIAAALGEGNLALEYLDGLKTTPNDHINVTTMYDEGWPVLETPFSAAQAIHEMLLQSWGEAIHIFPAMPDAWADAAFHDLLAEGGFLVSAIRRGGRTVAVRIKSQHGQPCRVKLDMKNPRVQGGQAALRGGAGGIFELPLAKGQEVVLLEEGHAQIAVVPVAAPAAQGQNVFGLK